MQLYDLSLTIAPNASEPVPVTIDYTSHEAGARILGKPLGLEPSDWPDGMAISTEFVSLSSHTGTHVDAPLHYGPICEGVPSKAIDEVPLEWFFQDGVLLRADDIRRNGPVAVDEIRCELKRISYSLKPLDIVLVQTGACRRWGKPEYFTDFRGISVEATEWLTSQGVKVIGIDSFGFDPPFHRMLATYQSQPDPKHLWPAHIYGRSREYCQIERLANLESLPRQHGFKVACFPVKIDKAGAGWSRVVAIF